LPAVPAGAHKFPGRAHFANRNSARANCGSTYRYASGSRNECVNMAMLKKRERSATRIVRLLGQHGLPRFQETMPPRWNHPAPIYVARAVPKKLGRHSEIDGAPLRCQPKVPHFPSESAPPFDRNGCPTRPESVSFRRGCVSAHNLTLELRSVTLSLVPVLGVVTVLFTLLSSGAIPSAEHSRRFRCRIRCFLYEAAVHSD
jgi:hypothetical protein